jgi:hypothetical protein
MTIERTLVASQQKLQARNPELPRHRWRECRLGIDLGDA